MTGADLVQEAHDGDREAARVVELWGERLGIGIANAIHIFDPEEVVIGGGAARAGDLLLEPARRTAAAYVLPGLGRRTTIRAARHGVRAGVLGAALLAVHELSGGPGPSPTERGGSVAASAERGRDRRLRLRPRRLRAARAPARGDRRGRPRAARLRHRPPGTDRLSRQGARGRPRRRRRPRRARDHRVRLRGGRVGRRGQDPRRPRGDDPRHLHRAPGRRARRGQRALSRRARDRLRGRGPDRGHVPGRRGLGEERHVRRRAKVAEIERTMGATDASARARPRADGLRALDLRHGETEWSRAGRHTSHTDIPLTDHGRAQAAHRRPRARRGRVLARALQPAAASPGDLPAAGFEKGAEITDALHEWDYGDYEGLTSAEIHADRPDWDLWHDGCPGGEGPAQVGARVDRVLAASRRSTASRSASPTAMCSASSPRAGSAWTCRPGRTSRWPPRASGYSVTSTRRRPCCRAGRSEGRCSPRGGTRAPRPGQVAGRPFVTTALRGPAPAHSSTPATLTTVTHQSGRPPLTRRPGRP